MTSRYIVVHENVADKRTTSVYCFDTLEDARNYAFEIRRDQYLRAVALEIPDALLTGAPPPPPAAVRVIR